MNFTLRFLYVIAVNQPIAGLLTKMVEYFNKNKGIIIKKQDIGIKLFGFHIIKYEIKSY